MKKNTLVFLIVMTVIQFVNAQEGPLGLLFDGKPTISSCSGGRPICKMKVKIMTPNGGGSLHVSAFLDGQQSYHVHTELTGTVGQVVEISFLGAPPTSSSTNRWVSVQMYVGSFGSNDRVSYIEDRFPITNNDLTPELVVMASNNYIGYFLQSLVVTPSSSFGLTRNSPFYINLFKSKDVTKYVVAVRNNGSGITNSSEYILNISPMNANVSTEEISALFNSLYFGFNRSYDYTVFIQARDCQGNIVDSKDFQVIYKPIQTSGGIRSF